MFINYDGPKIITASSIHICLFQVPIKMAERFKTSQDLWHNQAVYEAQKRELKTINFYN